jgi:predicted transcriptional regulator
MATIRALSSEEWVLIVVSSECGMRQIHIGNRLVVSQSVVAKTLRKYRKGGIFSSVKRQGCQRATTHRTNVMIQDNCDE